MLSATGCIFRAHSDYPTDWSPIDRSYRADKAATAPCPRLVGRFYEVGIISPLNPIQMCSTSSSHYEWALDWLCDMSLLRNLTLDESLAGQFAIEIQQPDMDTLRISYGNAGSSSVDLHRSSGDFSCSTDGLTRVQHDIWRGKANARGGPENPVGRVFETTAAVIDAPVFFFGGVANLTRTFNVTTDGSLVMKITHSRHGLMLAVPVSEKYATYVMWKPFAADAPSPLVK
jgi:hypothetical protein